MKKLATYLWQQILIALLCVSLVACTPRQVDTVLSDIDLVLQTANSLSAAVGALSPADAAALSLLTGIGITGVNAIKTAYDTYEANKTASNLQNIIAATDAIQTNLPQELAALHISNAAVVQKATAWVNLVTDLASFVVREVGAVAASAPHTMTLSMPTPETLQARWQSEVCAGDTACGALVKVHHRHLHKKLL